MRASVSSTESDEARVSPEQRTGLSECRQSGGVDHQFTQTPLAKHASFSGSLVAEVSSLCISSVCLITLEFPNAELIELYRKRQPTISEHQQSIADYLRLRPFGDAEASQLGLFLFEESCRLEHATALP
jgi:hypothetical protein